MRCEWIVGHFRVTTRRIGVHAAQGNVLAQAAARIGKDDQNKIDANEPHGAKDSDRGQRSALQDGRLKGAAGGSGVGGVVADEGAMLAEEAVGIDNGFNLRYLVLGIRESSGFFDGLASGHDLSTLGKVAAKRRVVLREYDEPRDAKCRGINGVDDGINQVEPGEGEILHGRLFADMRRQDAGEKEGDEGVEVHGKL